MSRDGLALVLGAVALTALCYAPAFTNGFVWDDHIIVLTTRAYRDFDLRAIWWSRANGLEYLPVRDMTLALDMALWGERAVGFHVTNLLLHAATVLAAYRAARLLAVAADDAEPRRIATFAALLFGLHPLGAEAVYFINGGRNTLLAMLFLLLSLAAFLRGFGRSGPVSAASLLFFTLALLSKASAVFYPLVLTVLLVLFPALRPRARVWWCVLAAYFALDALMIPLHMAGARATGILNAELMNFAAGNAWWQLVKAAQIPLFYFKQFLAPIPLTVLYPSPWFDDGYLLRAAASLGTVSLLLYAAWRVRARSRLPLAGLLWVLFALVPVLNLVPNTPVVADRYAYAPLFGFALALAPLLAAASRRTSALAVLLVVLLVFGFLDFHRGRDWRNDVTLFESAFAADRNDGARRMYADALFNTGDRAAALALYRGEAAGHFHGRFLEGRDRLDRGDLRGAVAVLQSAVRRGGETERTVWLALARAREAAGATAAALDAYLRAIENPGTDLMHHYLPPAREGVARTRRHLEPERAALRAAVENAPERFEVRFAYARFLQTSGEYDEAGSHYLAAAALQPERFEPWYNLGLIRARRREHARAIEAFLEVLRRRPDHGQAMNHLGVEYAALRDEDQAVAWYGKALAADPGMPAATANLGRLHFRLGRRAEAERMFRSVLEDPRSDEAARAQAEQALRQLR